MIVSGSDVWTVDKCEIGLTMSSQRDEDSVMSCRRFRRSSNKPRALRRVCSEAQYLGGHRHVERRGLTCDLIESENKTYSVTCDLTKSDAKTHSLLSAVNFTNTTTGEPRTLDFESE